MGCNVCEKVCFRAIIREGTKIRLAQKQTFCSVKMDVFYAIIASDMLLS